MSIMNTRFEKKKYIGTLYDINIVYGTTYIFSSISMNHDNIITHNII